MPINHLHSLDGLLLSVRDNESKRLAQEAITAYQAGAYRAAILSIWVAVCADIISKLKEIATSGDAAAVTEVTKLETWINAQDLRNLQQFENGLIELARDRFEMLLPHETTDLIRLREDRNLCAHPALVSDEALFSPTPELARAHIVHAILHLLSGPPVQGKQLISRYDRDLLGGSIPKSKAGIEVVLRQNYLARAKPAAVASMIKALAKALVGAEAPKYAGKEDQIALSLAAIGGIFPGPFEEHLPPLIERLGREGDDAKILFLCHYIEAEPRIWEWLGEAGQARILAKIDNVPLSELGSAAKARHIEAVGAKLLVKLKLGDVRMMEKAIGRVPCKAFVGEALAIYGNSGSFAAAQDRGVELVLSHAPYLGPADIEQIDALIRRNRNDQILNAGQTPNILIQLFDQTRHLLPDSAPHWSAIARYVAEKNAANNSQYPQFFEELRKAGIEVPAVDDPE